MLQIIRHQSRARGLLYPTCSAAMYHHVAAVAHTLRHQAAAGAEPCHGVQLGSVSKAMAAAVASMLDDKRSHLYRLESGYLLGTQLLLSWAGRVQRLRLDALDLRKDTLGRFLAAAKSLHELQLHNTHYMRWNTAVFEGLSRMLEGLPCLRELSFDLHEEGWLPSSVLASKVDRLTAEFSLHGSRIPANCMRFLEGQLESRGQLELCCRIWSPGLEEHEILVDQLRSLYPSHLRLRLFSGFAQDVQRCWQALSGLQSCHLELQPTDDSDLFEDCYEPAEPLRALPCSETLIIDCGYSREPVSICWQALTQQTGTVVIRVHWPQQLLIVGDTAAPPDCSALSGQLKVQGPWGLRGFKRRNRAWAQAHFQATPEGLLMQMSAAQAAGQGPARA